MTAVFAVGSTSFKAIASGADLVAMGRPVIYGLALGGSTGVQQVFDFFKKEIRDGNAISRDSNDCRYSPSETTGHHYM